MAAIKFDITGDNKNVLDSFNGVQQGVRKMQAQVEKSGQSVETMFQRVTSSALGGIKQLAAGVAGLTALMESGQFLKSLYSDMGKFNVAMKEVSTLSEEVTNNLEAYKEKVVELCTQIAIAPEEAAKALYQIESAGHHGADGLNVLEQAAKGAIGGVTETEVAADAITTILNSYKMEASEAARINDLLFTTVRLGKTTYGELGRVIAQVTPVASAYGVAIEDVLAAVASLTKSGTKTSIAVRQVRDAITATTASLGDGTFKTRTFLEAMDEVAEKTKGSESALKSDLSKLSAMNAVLALTGQNAASAKQDFIEMQNSTGAATEAYEKMANTAGNATTRLRNNLFAYFMPIGDEIRSMSKSIAEALNEAFDDGSMQTALGTLEAFIASYAVYRGMLAANGLKNSLVASSEVAATNAAYQAEIAQLQTIIPLKEAEAKSDIEIAVAEGRLTPEKAALITSLREEAAAHLANLQAQAAEAKAAFEEATTLSAQIALRLEEAEAAVAAAEMKYQAAVRSGSATAVESAELELNTAISTKNGVAKELQAARQVASTAATKASTTAKIAESAATVVDTAAQKADATATGVLAGVKLTLKRAIDAVNASFLASPLFWMGAVIVGVTYGIYKLCTAESAHDAAVRKSNEAMEEQAQRLEERKNNMMSLIRTIQDKNATELQQVDAYNQLKTIAPELTQKYTQQQIALLDLNDAQKELNQSLDDVKFEEARRNVEKYEQAIKDIEDIMEQDARYNGGRNAIFNLGQLDRAEENLAQAKKVFNELMRLRREVEEKAKEEAIPIEVRIQTAQDNVEVMQEIHDFYAQAIDLTEHWQLANEQIDFSTGETRLEAFIREAEADLEGMRQKLEADPFNVNLEMAYEEKQKILDGLKEIKRNAEQGGFNRMDFMLDMKWNINYTALQNQLQAAIGKLQGLTAGTVEGGAVSLQMEYDAAQKRYEAAVKALQNIDANRAQYTKEQRIAAESELKTAKENYAAVGGDPDGKKGRSAANDAKRQANERAQRLKAEQKYNEMLRKQRVERERAAKDLEFSTTQATIDAMEEGSEKTLAQINLDFEKQKEEIERGYIDLKQKKIDQARQLWEANPANKGKLFDESSVDTSYTEDETENYKALLAAAEAEHKRHLEELQRQNMQYLYDYVKEYGSIQDRRAAIAAEYADKIAKEQNAIQKAALEKERDNLLAELDIQELQNSIDWETVFDNLDRLSTEALRRLKAKLKASLDMKDISPENAQVLAEKILEIEDKITERTNIWTSLIPALRERERLTRAAAEAQEDYNRKLREQQEAMDKVFGLQVDIIDQIKQVVGEDMHVDLDLHTVTPDQKLDIFELYGIDETSEAGQRLTDAFDQLQIASTDLGKSMEETSNAQKRVSNANAMLSGSSIGDIFKNAQQSAGGGIMGIINLVNENSQSLADFVDKVGLENTDFGQSVHGFSDGVSGFTNAVSSLAKGDVIGAVNGVLDGIAGFGKMGINAFIGGGNEDDMEKEIAELSRVNEILSDSIERLAQRISDSTSTNKESVESYQKALAAEREWEANQRKEIRNRASEYANTGYGFLGLGGKSSFNANAQGGGWQGWADFNRVLREHGYSSTVNSASSMWNLTPEELELLRDFAPSRWAELFATDGHRNPQDLVNEYIERSGKLDELTSVLNEKLTGYSWDGFMDSYKSMLKNLDSTTEDFADHIQELITNALIESFVNETLKEDIKALYDYIAEASADGMIDAAEKAEIERKNQAISDKSLLWRENIQASGMIKSSSNPYEQNGTSGGWASMGQDTADELNGRFTALQMSGEKISEGITTMVTTLSALSALADGRNLTLIEIRNLMITNNAFLEDILEANKKAYGKFEQQLDKIVTQTK